MKYVLQERQVGQSWQTVGQPSESYRTLNRKKAHFEGEDGFLEYRVVPETQANEEAAAEEAAETQTSSAEPESEETEEVRWLQEVCC